MLHRRITSANQTGARAATSQPSAWRAARVRTATTVRATSSTAAATSCSTPRRPASLYDISTTSCSTIRCLQDVLLYSTSCFTLRHLHDVLLHSTTSQRRPALLHLPRWAGRRGRPVQVGRQTQRPGNSAARRRRQAPNSISRQEVQEPLPRQTPGEPVPRETAQSIPRKARAVRHGRSLRREASHAFPWLESDLRHDHASSTAMRRRNISTSRAT